MLRVVSARCLKTEPDWTRLPSDVPASIRKLLRLCLEKNAKNRRSDAADVRIDIEQAVAEPVAVAPAAAPATGVRLLWVVAAAAVLVAVSIGFVHFRETPPVQQSYRFQIASPPNTRFTTFRLSP